MWLLDSTDCSTDCSPPPHLVVGRWLLVVGRWSLTVRRSPSGVVFQGRPSEAGGPAAPITGRGRLEAFHGATAPVLWERHHGPRQTRPAKEQRPNKVMLMLMLMLNSAISISGNSNVNAFGVCPARFGTLFA